MINPKVQRSGDVAVLTFNLVDQGAGWDGPDHHSLGVIAPLA